MYNDLFGFSLEDGGKMTQRKIAKMKNNRVFMNEFMRNMNDALNRYHLEGLPDTCNQRVILQSFLNNACVTFYEKGSSLLALPGWPSGKGINIYGDFAGSNVYGFNGYTDDVDVFMPGSDEDAFLNKTFGNLSAKKPKGVIVRENEYMYPFLNYALYYAERMADTLRKIETAQKYTAVGHIFSADESRVSTIEGTLKAVFDENQTRVVGRSPLSDIGIESIAFPESAASVDTLVSSYEWLCNQYRQLCGFDSGSNMDKKGENLLNAEISMGEDYVDRQRASMISCIQKGLDDVNKLFGTNITVEEGGVKYDDVCRDDTEDTGFVSNNDSNGSSDNNI